MNPVQGNPYRTLGLFGNSSEKEVQKQISTIKRFAEVGKMKSFEFDFPMLGEVVRNETTIKEASSLIEQGKNKIHYALFWFLNNGHIDEAALNNLKEGHTEKAIQIWEKSISKLQGVTEKNFSAISNLSTLHLGSLLNNGGFNYGKLCKSIELKRRLLASDNFINFVSIVAGDGFTANNDEITKAYVDEVIDTTKEYIFKPVIKAGVVEGNCNNGIGLYCWENEDVFFGEWQDGARSGFGIYLWGSGHSYFGNFKSGKFHGEGLYVYENFSKRVGIWEDDTYQKEIEVDPVAIHLTITKNIERIKSISGITFKGITKAQLINAFQTFPPEIKDYITKKLSEPLIKEIEDKLEISRNLREAKPADSGNIGAELFTKAKSQLLQIKNILGERGVQYQILANKISEELLQCSIDFFNHWSGDIKADPGERSLKLITMAKSFKPVGQLKSRIEENEKTITEWVNEKPERDKQNKIGEHVNFIISKLNLAVETLNNNGKYPKGYKDPYSDLLFDEQPQNRSISTKSEELSSLIRPSLVTSLMKEHEFNINLFRLARDIVNQCKPKLQIVKNNLPGEEELYLKLSNDLASVAMGCLIAYVNNSGNATYGIAPKITEHEINAMNAIGELEMSFELRSRYNEQRRVLNNLLRASQTQATQSTSNSSGCYIATMAYGSYDHPQVIQLRTFRDTTLSKSILGRSFIRTYYRLSPGISEVLKDQAIINFIIRNLLNSIIRIINEKRNR